MSDIAIDNRSLTNLCSGSIQQCKLLKEEIRKIEQGSSVTDLLQTGHLLIRFILCELQILKVQVSVNIKVTEKQIMVLRNKFAKIISLYQKVFIKDIPCSMQEVANRIEMIGLEYEEHWLKDIRMLGLGLTLFGNHTPKSNSHIVVLSYQYQFTAIFRNSILCKNLRPTLGEDNRMCTIRREQLEVFHRFAHEQMTKQNAIFVRTQSIAGLENAIRITRALIELGFITESQFFDPEYYKKQEDAFVKVLTIARESARK
ncbi:hypothetical protein P0082_04905 [Candidatus Haliotispira prima]|uniref:Uncharacterized protein n=1 Tax=Candidatus Haliotispira prima TaxID=3034016 RepID=A0ABY8MK19_9SPIO|nr:hypothetical protein P0082_04905 [Candidatus Haliotispira prima]